MFLTSFHAISLLNYKTALHFACENNNAEIVELLLSHSVIDINTVMEIYIIVL